MAPVYQRQCRRLLHEARRTDGGEGPYSDRGGWNRDRAQVARVETRTGNRAEGISRGGVAGSDAGEPLSDGDSVSPRRSSAGCLAEGAEKTRRESRCRDGL